MIPAEIKELREALGWSLSKMAKQLETTYRTANRWEHRPPNARVKMAPIHERRLEALFRFTFGREPKRGEE